MKRTIYFFYVFIVIAIIGFIKFAFFPTPYKGVYWFESAGFQRFSKYDFTTYELPDEYELVTFRRDKKYRQRLLLYKKKKSDRVIVFCMIRGFSEVDFEKISFNPTEPKRPFWSAEMYPLTGGHFFAIWHYFPFGFRDDFEHSDNDLILKGIKVFHQETFETEKTKVLYVAGEFEKLGFYKKSDTWRPFMTPVLDFIGPRKGVVAIINEKTSGQTLFAIGCNYKNFEFDESEFRGVVKSLTFDNISFKSAEDIFGKKMDDLETIEPDRITRVTKTDEYLKDYLENWKRSHVQRV